MTSGLRKIVRSVPLGAVRLGYRVRHPERFRILRAPALREPPRSPDAYSVEPFLRTRSLFVHIPKCAGISVATSIYGCRGGGHFSIRDYQIIFSSAEYRSLFKFTFVRNPWDRLVSAYHFLRAGGINEADRQYAAEIAAYNGFDDFVTRYIGGGRARRIVHFRPQHRFVCPSREAPPAVDFIGRFETIEADFAKVCQVIGIEAQLAATNRTATRPDGYRRHYTNRTAEIVASVYRRDTALFGYTF